ncbi:MAG: hypothetical protein KFF73_05400 [Cyclobacteriaceae bacterium]|nr:hypothetical protein [Cyclobacteriaceae bacterium]
MPCRSLIIISIFIFICIPESQAQRIIEGDTAVLVQPVIDSADLKYAVDTMMTDSSGENRANKAAMYAAILPGLGQIYNKRYWKLPILYGGAATMGFFIDYNHKKYEQFRNAYLEKTSLPEELWTDPLAINVAEDNLQNGIDFYRRNRDLLMILLAGVYFLQIVDAHVDAHLMDFDISEDISFRIQPGLIPDSYTASMQYGMKFIISFN